MACLCQATNYGQIRDLTVVNREPILDAPNRVVLLDVRLDFEDSAREDLAAADFGLCKEVRRLMDLLDQIGNGRISQIEVRAGIPRRMTFEGPLKIAGR